MKIHCTGVHLLSLLSRFAEKKRTRLTFPWWCVFLAYGLSFILAVTSIFFIIARGIEFGDLKTRQWLTSIVAGFFSSVFLSQPLKVSSSAYWRLWHYLDRTHSFFYNTRRFWYSLFSSLWFFANPMMKRKKMLTTYSTINMFPYPTMKNIYLRSRFEPI